VRSNEYNLKALALQQRLLSLTADIFVGALFPDISGNQNWKSIYSERDSFKILL